MTEDPLITSNASSRAIESMGPTAVVLVAHGSRAEAANDAHRAVVAALTEATGLTVWPAFLELAEPSIPAAVDDAVAAGAERVLVLPYFLYPGRHLTQDIPALVDEAAGRHPGVEVTMIGAFGTDPAVVDLLADQIRSATRG